MTNIIWRVFYVVSFVMVLMLFYSLHTMIKTVNSVFDLSTVLIQRQERSELLIMRALYDSGVVYKAAAKCPPK